MAGNEGMWRDLGFICPEFDGKVLNIETDEIWVFKHAGAFKAVSNICPHKMGPISEGVLEDGMIECPWHGYRFDINSGDSLRRSCPSLRVYETKIENGHLFVREKE